MDQRGPTGYRVSLGKELRTLREQAEITREEMAAAVGWDMSKVSRVEAGKAVPRAGEVGRLLELYKADEETIDRVKSTASQARRRGRYGKAPDWARTYLGLEPDAIELSIYYGEAIPGLFQTARYARAFVSTSLAVAPTDVDQLVADRMARQALLERHDPPRIRTVIGQSALTYAVGGHAGMVEQIDRLIDLFQHPAITGQVLPWEGGAHAALSSDFIVLTADTAGETTEWVYSEGLDRADCTPDPARVRLHRLTFESLMVNALSESETLTVLRKSRDDHAGKEDDNR